MASECSLLTKKINNLAALTLRRRNWWLAVLPVAFLQLSLAVHQFDHIADYVEGACHVCVQLDRLDAAVDNAAVVKAILSPSIARADSPTLPISRVAVRFFDSRAPPKI